MTSWAGASRTSPAGYPYTAASQAGDVAAVADAVAGLGRPPRIAVFSTPVIRAAARAVVRRWPGLDRRFFAWQVGGFIADPAVRGQLVPQLYEQSLAARPAFWRLNDDLLTAAIRHRRRIGDLRRFTRPVQVIFGARDRYLNPRVARNLAGLFPHSQLHLLDDAGHYVQVDQPKRVADLITAPDPSTAGSPE